MTCGVSLANSLCRGLGGCSEVYGGKDVGGRLVGGVIYVKGVDRGCGVIVFVTQGGVGGVGGGVGELGGGGGGGVFVGGPWGGGWLCCFWGVVCGGVFLPVGGGVVGGGGFVGGVGLLGPGWGGGGGGGWLVAGVGFVVFWRV